MTTTILRPDTLKRLAPYYTSTMGFEDFINRLIDAYQSAGNPTPPWSWSLDDLALAVSKPLTDKRFDLNGDKYVNSLDQTLAAMFEVPPHAPVLSGYTVEQLIADSTGYNDGHVCPPVDTYDWGIRGHGLDGKIPTGDQITGWGTGQWLQCGASIPGAHLETKNLKVMALMASHTWQFFGGGFDWVSTFDPNTTSGSAPAQGTPGNWVMPQGQRAIHWATFRLPNIANILGVVTVYEARGEGIMANAGFDDIHGGNILGDVFISKYKKLDKVNWTHVGGSSVPASLLRAYPPPL